MKTARREKDIQKKSITSSFSIRSFFPIAPSRGRAVPYLLRVISHLPFGDEAMLPSERSVTMYREKHDETKIADCI